MLLNEKRSFKDGAAQERNFHAYPLLGPADAPDIDVHIVPSTEPPGGIGEPGLPPLPGAVCNVIFAATGKRLRSMPIGGPFRVWEGAPAHARKARPRAGVHRVDGWLTTSLPSALRSPPRRPLPRWRTWSAFPSGIPA